MITTSVAEAAAWLKDGQVLAYPTEAVWGLGCDPYNEQAFHQILTLKQRPIEKGVILLAAHLSQVETSAAGFLSEEMREKVIESWNDDRPADRATTWLLPAHQEIPGWIKGTS